MLRRGCDDGDYGGDGGAVVEVAGDGSDALVLDRGGGDLHDAGLKLLSCIRVLLMQ